MLSLIFISLISTTLAAKEFTGFNGNGKVLLETPKNKGLVLQILDKSDFSVKNPTDIENGEKPELEEVGPFTYRQ